MDIIIKESGVAKPLVYMDTATGTECTLDILQMMGAFTNGTITYNEETKQYVAPIDEYNWWKDMGRLPGAEFHCGQYHAFPGSASLPDRIHRTAFRRSGRQRRQPQTAVGFAAQ